MVSTGGSNKFFLLDRLIQIGDGPSVHLLQFVLANVSENKNLNLKKCIKIKIITSRFREPKNQQLDMIIHILGLSRRIRLIFSSLIHKFLENLIRRGKSGTKHLQNVVKYQKPPLGSLVWTLTYDILIWRLRVGQVANILNS